MFAMAFFTIDYLIRLCFVHAVPYRSVRHAITRHACH